MPMDNIKNLYIISITYCINNRELRFKNWEAKVTYWK
jgi:hypothetical protein